ncbi:MAG TPA: ABC transporter permease [Devosia sp.]|nr:ABC transporter permease [Devosia sp.]
MSAILAAARRGWAGHWSLRVGVIATLVFLLIGFVSVAWTPYPIELIDVGAARQDPSAAHWLGTDHLGRDMVSLVMKGTLTSFVVAAIAVAIGAAIGVPLGLGAAAWGGPLEWIILRVSDFLFAFPALIIAILITTLFGPSAVNAMIAVGIFNIPVFARVARGGALSIKTLDYLAAARLAGLNVWEIAWKHVLPNILSLLIVQATIQLALGILAEASLSYVGLGTQPPGTSLGLMLKDAQAYVLLKPSLALIPGISIVLIVVALNLAGDGLRDLLDPRLRRIGASRGAG